MKIEQLRPYKITDKLIRLGNPSGDGGYIIPETILSDVDVLYSFGIGDNMSFEDDFSVKTNHKPVYMYDPTVNVTPKQDNQRFFKHGLSGCYKENYNNFINYYDMNHDTPTKVLLKVDVEAAEYEWLTHTDISVLSSICPCVIIEFHYITNPIIDTVMESLLQHYNIIHMHPNSYGGWSDGIPDVPEITFLNKSYDIYDGYVVQKYPLDIDKENNGAKPNWSIRWNDT